MEQYLRNLMEQFKIATGIYTDDIYSKAFISEFTSWVKERQNVGKEYTYFLDYMGFKYDDNRVAEVGKGEYDSVIKSYDTRMITTALPIKDVSTDRIIAGNMRVYESLPVLVKNIDGGNQLEQIPSSVIHTYMTQNPISFGSIMGWDQLHNSCHGNIILGIYGSINDKDVVSKIKWLESIKDKLSCGSYMEEYSTLDNNYFYVIGSHQNVRKKVKIK